MNGLRAAVHYDLQEVCSRLRAKDEALTNVGLAVPLGDREAVELGDAIRENPHVTSLILSVAHMTPDGEYRNLLDYLETSEKLVSVGLAFQEATAGVRAASRVAERLLRAVSRSKSIRSIVLKGSGTPVCVESISHVLKIETGSVENLGLLGCSLTTSSQEGTTTVIIAKELGDALTACKTLRGIFTDITDPVVLGAIFGAIRSNTEIQRFQFQGSLGLTACKALAEHLPLFTALRSLTVRFYASAAPVKELFLEGIKQNCSLLDIDVTATFLKEKDLARIKLYEQRNFHLPTCARDGEQVPVCQVPKMCVTALETAAGVKQVHHLLLEKGDDIGQHNTEREDEEEED